MLILNPYFSNIIDGAGCMTFHDVVVSTPDLDLIRFKFLRKKNHFKFFKTFL